MRLRGDFNGLFATEDGGLILCLSHGETALDELDNEIHLVEGMTATAFEPDIDDDGNPDNLVAHGVVTSSPDGLQCKGSRWSLLLNEQGCYHESDGPKS